jgi:hypothetical protein
MTPEGSLNLLSLTPLSAVLEISVRGRNRSWASQQHVDVGAPHKVPVVVDDDIQLHVVEVGGPYVDKAAYVASRSAQGLQVACRLWGTGMNWAAADMQALSSDDGKTVRLENW